MKSQLLRSICLTGLIAAVCLSSAAAENAGQTAASLFQQGVTAGCSICLWFIGSNLVSGTDGTLDTCF